MCSVRHVTLAAAAILTGIQAFAATDLSQLLAGVENRYNKPRTMSFTFEQTYSGGGRMTRSERGELYLQKPGKMRWKYTDPAGKLFVTDGKFAYYYSPSTNQVDKAKLKETDDMRAPLAFLMGRLDFRRDFKEFRTYQEGKNTYIVATPKSEKAPYTQVAFVVNPQYQIEMLRVNGQDQSILVYRLSDEKMNPALDASMFTFEAPPGARIVDASDQP
ncbi:MAG: outer membrane lipoprotein chaperone LolA [Bryobacterales bacterium]|nr:outer membrane lipoprotein chaperone LolA [Bryobacterales bacterium]